MNRDTVIGIVGCTVLIAAMVGVFSYERANAQPIAPDSGAPNASISGITGTIALGKSDARNVNVTTASAHNVTFHLTWKATNGKDSLHLKIAPPEGSAIPKGGEDTKDTGDIIVTVSVPDGMSSAGAWNVEVTFTTATPGPLPGGVPPPTPPPGSTDASVSYTVAASTS